MSKCFHVWIQHSLFGFISVERATPGHILTHGISKAYSPMQTHKVSL
jgi:hypothetical protein